MEYRIRATGAVVSDAELRAANPDSVLPSPLTTDALAFVGADAVLQAPAPTVTATQTVSRNGVTQDTSGNWVTAWIVTDMTAPQAAAALVSTRAALMTQVGARQVVAKAAGLSYSFPDGQTGIIQTDDASLSNVNGLVTAALVLQSLNNTTTAISFRDAGNVTHPLTPAQTVSMGLAVQSFVSGTYAIKWTKETEISALADLPSAAAYNINAGF